MFKKILIAISMALVCKMSFAMTCPTVHQIKTNHFAGWKAYDSDDGKPLSPARAADFKKNAVEFVLAEWTKEKRKGSIHCYYRDKNGSNLEAYLAKDNYAPHNPHNYWYEVSGSMHCAAGMTKCEFREIGINEKRVASR